MKMLMTLFVFAFMLSVFCGQAPSMWRDVAPLPTMAPAEGGGLARLTPTAEGQQATPEAQSSGDEHEQHDHGEGDVMATPFPLRTATAVAPMADAGEESGATSGLEEGEVSGAAEEAATDDRGSGPEPGALDGVRGVQGALVRVTMAGEVGLLLDELPTDMQPRVVEALRALPEEAWLARAERQMRLTRLRLNFRDSSSPGKGQLPLPQPDQWSIALDEAGLELRTVQGHRLLMVGYTFSTTILSDAASLAHSEPALADVGGVWQEYFVLPADPDMLLQRTGRACINDAGFPPNSVDTQNAGHFFDFDRQNCFEVLAARVGAIETRLRFERVAWNEALADRVRTPLPQQEGGADLAVVGEDLAWNYLSYRFVTENDCAFVEEAVTAPGWRRLLHFEATVHNVGDRPLHIGRAVAEGGPAESGESVFVYAPCHDHVHYRHYGLFTLDEGELESSKQAFCVQSTDRMSNHELSPLTHDYSCRFQGIQVGWVDEYISGLDTQWVDVTDLEIGPEGRTVVLGFVSNPEGFLCEGMPGFDENGGLLWEPSGLQTEEGVEILRPQCVFAADWDRNNVETFEVFIPPAGSMVTAPCGNGELGPLRDCGFEPLEIDGLELACRVGQQVDLHLALEAQAAPVVLRACERSAALGTGIACSYLQSLSNQTLENSGLLSFTCPTVRDGEADAGNFSLYVAPLWPDDEAGEVTVDGG